MCDVSSIDRLPYAIRVRHALHESTQPGEWGMVGHQRTDEIEGMVQAILLISCFTHVAASEP